jgi:hypothetical protein
VPLISAINRGTSQLEGLHAMLKNVFRGPNYGVRLAQCILMEWMVRYNTKVQADRNGVERPLHFDIPTIADIQAKCEELGIAPSFKPWKLPPATSEQFGLFWEAKMEDTPVADTTAVETFDEDTRDFLEETFESRLENPNR